MNLLNIYNSRELYRSISIEGMGPVSFTGNIKGSGQNILIEVMRRDGRNSWEQYNCSATAKAVNGGTSPVPSIVRQLDCQYEAKRSRVLATQLP